jgi:hypothetical protein
LLNLAQRSLGDPQRLVVLEQQLEAHMGEILSEAADAGYSTAEVLMAFRVVCDRQRTALAEDPDAA